MFNTHIPATEALAWLRGGWARLQQEPLRWLGMALTYVVIALLFKPIPLPINFLLILVTPVLLGGALIAARNVHPTSVAPADANGVLRALTTGAWSELFQPFRREEHMFPIVIASIVMIGIAFAVNIPILLITRGSIVSGLSAVELGAIQPGTVIGVLVALALYAVLAMSLLYVMPLVLFGNRQAFPAVVESFRACKQNGAAVALFVAPFFLLYSAITLTFSMSRLLGYALMVLFGVVALPLFVLGLHHSYRVLFEAPAPVTVGKSIAP
jgi:hypothetical protein